MERAHMQEFVDKFYNEKRSSAQSSRVRLAMSRQKALEKMELIPDPRLEVVCTGVLLFFTRHIIIDLLHFFLFLGDACMFVCPGSGLDAVPFPRPRWCAEKRFDPDGSCFIQLSRWLPAARRCFRTGRKLRTSIFPFCEYQL